MERQYEGKKDEATPYKNEMDLLREGSINGRISNKKPAQVIISNKQSSEKNNYEVNKPNS